MDSNSKNNVIIRTIKAKEVRLWKLKLHQTL